MHSDSVVSLIGTSSSSSSLSPQDIDPPSQPRPEALPLIDQLQQLTKEKQTVEAELQRCQEAEREASERVRRSDLFIYFILFGSLF